MFRLCSLLLVLGYIVYCPVLGVIGGGYAKQKQIPYQVNIRARKGHTCGGGLVARKIVITAAHCTHGEPLIGLTVVAGTNNRLTGGTIIRVDSVKEHPRYNPKTNEYDLAIIFLQKRFEYGLTIQPIELPRIGATIPGGAKATVSGWGIETKEGEKSENLKFVDLPIWTKKNCYNYLKVIKAPVYCGGEKSGNNNVCDGDSGGPLVYNKKLFGVVSFGFGCGTPEKPSIYTDISSLRRWINDTAHI